MIKTIWKRSPNFASSSNMAPILAKAMVIEGTRWIKYNHVKMNGTDKTLGGIWLEEKKKKYRSKEHYSWHLKLIATYHLRSLSTIIENDKENTIVPCMLAQTYNPSATENETRGLLTSQGIVCRSLSIPMCCTIEL